MKGLLSLRLLKTPYADKKLEFCPCPLPVSLDAGPGSLPPSPTQLVARRQKRPFFRILLSVASADSSELTKSWTGPFCESGDPFRVLARR